MFEALADLRDRAPVVAFPYGGTSSYWHNRDSGQWAAYVLSELIPKLIRRFDIAPRKVAIGGISMGGFGAYDIARLSPKRFCAIGGHSPAIWESASETADGAFDDAADFDRNDIIEAAKLTPSPYRGTRLWIDAGDDDPFLPGRRGVRGRAAPRAVSTRSSATAPAATTPTTGTATGASTSASTREHSTTASSRRGRPAPASRSTAARVAATGERVAVPAQRNAIGADGAQRG